MMMTKANSIMLEEQNENIEISAEIGLSKKSEDANINKLKHIKSSKNVVSFKESFDENEKEELSNSPISSKKMTISDFEVVSILGRGSYAKVVHARYLDNHKDVAIKVVDKKFINKMKKSHESLIEREILSSLDHPSIIKLLSTFHDKDKLYFVLEYAPNNDLSALIRSQGLLSYNLAKFYAAEIVSALDYLHSKKIAHRDLKPENIIIDINMHIKIIDFSTASIKGKFFDRKKMKFVEEDVLEEPKFDRVKSVQDIYEDRSDSLLGTAEYASPEMLSNAVINSFSTDIWALGCMIYKFFHGKTPFRASSEWIIFDNIINMRLNISKHLPEEVQDLINLLLKESPDERLGAGERGTPLDIEHLKQHKFFSGIDFETIHLQNPPIQISQSSSKLTNLKNFSKSTACLFKNSLNASSTSENSDQDIRGSCSPQGPQLKLSPLKKKASKEFCLNSYISSSIENSIIDDYYIFNLDEQSERKLLYENFVEKKSWMVYTQKKIKLYSNKDLELWNKDNTVIQASFSLNGDSRLCKLSPTTFQVEKRGMVHKFKSTESEIKSLLMNL